MSEMHDFGVTYFRFSFLQFFAIISLKLCFDSKFFSKSKNFVQISTNNNSKPKIAKQWQPLSETQFS